MRLWCRETGEVKPVPCRRLVCPVCIRSAAWRRSLAIAYTKPERFLTLSLVGNDWQTVRGRLRRLRYDLVQELGNVEWVWTVEQNPEQTGHHVHAWQRGDFLPQKRLSTMAARRGMGEVVDIRRWRTGGESYALKEAYGVKDAGQAEGFLAMNGKRLTHQTRGFFGGPVREVESAAVDRITGPDRLTWEITSISELHAATGRAPR